MKREDFILFSGGAPGAEAEFAKLCNKPLFVFDQEKDAWFEWTGGDWRVRGTLAP